MWNLTFLIFQNKLKLTKTVKNYSKKPMKNLYIYLYIKEFIFSWWSHLGFQVTKSALLSATCVLIFCKSLAFCLKMGFDDNFSVYKLDFNESFKFVSCKNAICKNAMWADFVTDARPPVPLSSSSLKFCRVHQRIRDLLLSTNSNQQWFWICVVRRHIVNDLQISLSKWHFGSILHLPIVTNRIDWTSLTKT